MLICSPVVGASFSSSMPPLTVGLAAVREAMRPSCCKSLLLTGHAGYFNVGGLVRLDIPGAGVSCAVRDLVAPGTQSYNGAIVQRSCSHVGSHKILLQKHTRLCAGRYDVMWL